MSLKADMRKIIRAEVVPWEIVDAEGEESHATGQIPRCFATKPN